jgi:hypothetical protein
MSTASSLSLGWLDRASDASRTARTTARHAPGLHEQRDSDRAQAEFFIRDVFAVAYRARLGSLMPTLLAERDADGGILAACGLRRGGAGPLFLEAYLGQPVESAIGAHSDLAVARERIVEVGNLAVLPPFTAREFIASLTRHLLAGDAEWSVFTAVTTLRNAFARMGVPFLRLGVARLDALPEADRAAWGTYYDTAPEVLAVRVRDAAHALLARPRA